MKGSVARASPNAAGTPESDIPDDDSWRSRYMRALLHEKHGAHASTGPPIPRVLVQFWDELGSIPPDVKDCLDSWGPLIAQGFTRQLFDDRRAQAFITRNYGETHARAFEACGHPAMRCDYFRLCFIAKGGGFYVDADDYFVGGDVRELFQDTRLKLQPLCYDIATSSMVGFEVFSAKDADSPHWIYYANNNPLVAPPSHPVIREALASATAKVLSSGDVRRDIQSTTGPGNLTASLVRSAVEYERAGRDRSFAFVTNWNAIAVTRWPLSYRSDDRNWRNWTVAG